MLIFQFSNVHLCQLLAQQSGLIYIINTRKGGCVFLVMSIIIPFSKGLADVILVRATSNVFFVPEKISLLLVRIKCPVSNGLSLFQQQLQNFQISWNMLGKSCRYNLVNTKFLWCSVLSIGVLLNKLLPDIHKSNTFISRLLVAYVLLVLTNILK